MTLDLPWIQDVAKRSIANKTFLQICTYLERLTADLEAAAHPALDALTAQVMLWLAIYTN